MSTHQSAVPDDGMQTLFDPRAPEFVADPYPFYAMLRERDPVHRLSFLGVEHWWVTRHADIVAMLKDPRVGKTLPAGAARYTLPPEFARLAELPRNMLFRDPPDHARLRSLVSKAFTPRMVENLRPRIAKIIEDLLAGVAENGEEGEVELVSQLAFPLPAIVIAELMGIPPDDRDQFRKWSTEAMLAEDVTQPPEIRRRGLEANMELIGYFERLIEERRRQPSTDLISGLVVAQEQGDRLSRDEVLVTCMLMLVAGHETTTNLISAGLLALLEHPKQLQRLRSNLALMPQAVEELLRYVSPVQRSVYCALDDVEIGGVGVPKGGRIVPVFAAANRDPEVFADPERLDISREHNPHLAFGRGIHFCLGAPLARLEASLAFHTLLTRFANIEVAEPGAVWGPNTLMRGLATLPLRVRR